MLLSKGVLTLTILVIKQNFARIECDWQTQYYDGICKDCTTCRAGYYEKAPCRRHKDTLCRGCRPGKFSPEGEKHCHRCRRRCPPGEVIVKQCDQAFDTECKQCSPGTYYSKMKRQCLSCKVCPSGFYQKRKCSKTRNAVCRPCIKGYYSLNENVGQCDKCSDCPVGHFISKPCTIKNDAVCLPCRNGTYSDSKNTKYLCMACRRCDVGRQILRNCTAEEDAECGNCTTGFFQLQLRNSSQCIRCSECYDNDTSSIVEECRTGSTNPKKICYPRILSLHNKLINITPAALSEDNIYATDKRVRVSDSSSDNYELPVLIIILTAFSSTVILVTIIVIIVNVTLKFTSNVKHMLNRIPSEKENREHTDEWWEQYICMNPFRSCSTPVIVNIREDETMLHRARSMPLDNDSLEEQITFLPLDSFASNIYSVSRTGSIRPQR